MSLQDATATMSLGNVGAAASKIYENTAASLETIDGLSPIPSSVMDDRMKEALREISRIAASDSDNGCEMKHPFLINLALMRLYILKRFNGRGGSVYAKTFHSMVDQSHVDNSVPVDERFISQSLYYLRYADEVYDGAPVVADKDIVLNALSEGPATNNLMLPRHIVFLDHVTRSVVVAIRGTASLSDVETDLFIDTKPFKFNADSPLGLKMGEDVLAHRGIAQAAELLLKPVSEAIKKAFAVRGGRYKDYHVVVTGHSLGAGTSSLLGIMLADQKSFPVTVYAFASPPVLSSTMKDCHTYNQFPHCHPSHVNDQLCKIHNFVMNDDIIPRASRHEMLNMMNLLKVVDSLSWNAGKRTHMVLMGVISEEDAQEVTDSWIPLSPNSADGAIPLYAPGTVYIMKPIVKNVDGDDSDGDKNVLGFSAKANRSPSEVKYDLHRLKDPMHLYTGHFFTGDSM